MSTAKSNKICDTDDVSNSIQRTLIAASSAISNFQLKLQSSQDLQFSYYEASNLIVNSKGRLIVAGIGKSGHVARKVAATLCSTGTLSYYIHPTEASHGDMGMISRDDIVLCFSWSGESAELVPLLNYVSRFNISLIAMTSSNTSTLAAYSKINIILPKVIEACPHGLAPSTSSAIQMIAGDALAILLQEIKGFTPEMYHDYHPGGKLGAGLVKVIDIARKNIPLPILKSGSLMSDAILIMTTVGRGVAIIVDEYGILMGVITDGDLRRNMTSDLMSKEVNEVMNKTPKVINNDSLAANALNVMEDEKISSLILIDKKSKPTGVIYMHDLLNVGLV